MNNRLRIGIVVAVVLALAAWFVFVRPGVVTGTPSPSATTTPQTGGQDGAPQSQNVEAKIGQTVMALGVSITPREVVEDSRCPTDVQCIQAGRVRVRADLTSGLGSTDQIFLVGEPITTEAEAVTLLEVRPATKTSTVTLSPSDYTFVFKIEKRLVSYANASADMIRVTTPPPGAVVGKEFKIMGEARGNWYFEASFPIDILDRNGNKLATVVAQAKGEWMTTSFVPFEAQVKVPETYIGPAMVVLRKENASGLPENDASAWYPITIEY